mmetsp:Transcript_26363/g.54384  ORF Transcript_26363/g.54384 Transcript_26363/m.54384 type:complete len:87 (-) Transcript_26363:2436-2696(-)
MVYSLENACDYSQKHNYDNMGMSKSCSFSLLFLALIASSSDCTPLSYSSPKSTLFIPVNTSRASLDLDCLTAGGLLSKLSSSTLSG